MIWTPFPIASESQRCPLQIAIAPSSAIWSTYSFSVSQGRRATLLKMGVSHLESREKGEALQLYLPSFGGALHGSVTALASVARRWATKVTKPNDGGETSLTLGCSTIGACISGGSSGPNQDVEVCLDGVACRWKVGLLIMDRDWGERQNATKPKYIAGLSLNWGHINHVSWGRLPLHVRLWKNVVL